MVSLAVIVLIQGALPISVLAFSGVKGTLEDNAISIDARAVDNRRVNLESAMVKSWAGISRETVALTSALSAPPDRLSLVRSSRQRTAHPPPRPPPPPPFHSARPGGPRCAALPCR